MLGTKEKEYSSLLRQKSDLEIENAALKTQKLELKKDNQNLAICRSFCKAVLPSLYAESADFWENEENIYKYAQNLPRAKEIHYTTTSIGKCPTNKPVEISSVNLLNKKATIVYYVEGKERTHTCDFKN